MNHSGISQANFSSSITNLPIKSSVIDLMSYVEMLLVQDYDEQLKSMADSIKINTSLKKAYRNHKMKLNDFLSLEQNDGKVELNQTQFDILNSDPDFRWDKNLFDKSGGVKDYNKKESKIFKNPDYKNNNKLSLHDNIASNEMAQWSGLFDIKDPDGGKWHFNAKAGANYNYFTDSNIKLRATHSISGKNNFRAVNEINITLNGPQKDNHISMKTGSSPQLDGKEMKAGQTYSLEDGGLTSWDGQELYLRNNEGYQFKFKTQNQSIVGTIKSPEDGVFQDQTMPTGLIGQTFDKDKKTKFFKNSDSNTQNSKYLIHPSEIKEQLQTSTYHVSIDRIKAKIEKYQMKIDNLNSETELSQTELSTLTSQRKLAFESLSSMISKSHEGTSSIIRNIK